MRRRCCITALSASVRNPQGIDPKRAACAKLNLNIAHSSTPDLCATQPLGSYGFRAALDAKSRVRYNIWDSSPNKAEVDPLLTLRLGQLGFPKGSSVRQNGNITMMWV